MLLVGLGTLILFVDELFIELTFRFLSGDWLFSVDDVVYLGLITPVNLRKYVTFVLQVSLNTENSSSQRPLNSRS